MSEDNGIGCGTIITVIIIFNLVSGAFKSDVKIDKKVIVGSIKEVATFAKTLASPDIDKIVEKVQEEEGAKVAQMIADERKEVATLAKTLGKGADGGDGVAFEVYRKASEGDSHIAIYEEEGKNVTIELNNRAREYYASEDKIKIKLNKEEISENESSIVDDLVCRTDGGFAVD